MVRLDACWLSLTLLLAGQPVPPGVDPVPGLGPARTAYVVAYFLANDRQGALDALVHFKYMDYAIDVSLLLNKKMEYDASVTSVDATTSMPAWDYITNRAEPSRVRVGPSAFSSLPYLYSVVMHEYQHVKHRQLLVNQTLSHTYKGHGGLYTGEVEASAWELLHARETGLASDADKIAAVWSTLNDEYWLLDPPARVAMQPLVQNAHKEASAFVKNTSVRLVPFQRPNP
jgi:hypothetical protein